MAPFLGVLVMAGAPPGRKTEVRSRSNGTICDNLRLSKIAHFCEAYKRHPLTGASRGESDAAGAMNIIGAPDGLIGTCDQW